MFNENMSFDELVAFVRGGQPKRSFLDGTGISSRMYEYVSKGGRRPGIAVWRALVGARPVLQKEIDAWFLKNWVHRRSF